MSDEKYALLIGNSAFEDARLSRLFAPHNDVNALRDILLDPAIGGFKQAIVLLDASVNETKAAIVDVVRPRRPSDMVLLYYTGHGVFDDHNDFYLATKETDYDRKEATALEKDWVNKRLDQCRALRQVVILDCCHSGAWGSKKGEGLITKDTFGLGDKTGSSASGIGRYLLTACNHEEFAWDAKVQKLGPKDTEGRLSIFTSVLVQGLKTGAAAPSRPFVSLDDLYKYAVLNVPKDAQPMSPRYFGEKENGELLIARNPTYHQRVQQKAKAQKRKDEEKQRLLLEIQSLKNASGANERSQMSDDERDELLKYKEMDAQRREEEKMRVTYRIQLKDKLGTLDRIERYVAQGWPHVDFERFLDFKEESFRAAFFADKKAHDPSTAISILKRVVVLCDKIIEEIKRSAAKEFERRVRKNNDDWENTPYPPYERETSHYEDTKKRAEQELSRLGNIY